MKVEKSCLWCGKTFFVETSKVRRGVGKFCSRSCSTTYRNTYNNPTKDVEVRAKISLHHANVSGENNPMYQKKGEDAPGYKDGRSSFTGEIYRRILLASGRKQECEVCKTTSNLCVHHIDGDHKNNVLENLMWVCYKCHNNIKHNYKRDSSGRFVSEISQRK